MKNIKIRKAAQKGFTLLELLVVITILAVLATGALLAYEGLTDSASAGAAANNAATADQSIRNYKAVTGRYPNQWDHLVTDSGNGSAGGVALDFVADATYRFLAQVDASAVAGPIQDAFARVGVNEFQVRTNSGVVSGVEPNLLHNEGAVQLAGATGSTVELGLSDGGVRADFFNRLVVVPTTNENATSLCQVGGALPNAIRVDPAANVTLDASGAGTGFAKAANFINKINDFFEPGDCHLIAAFGFGNDAAKSTTGSPVAIASAPTYVSGTINPSTQYARYIALFHLGTDGDGDENVEDTEIFAKPKLLAVLDAEGKLVDQNIAAVQSGN